MIANAFRFSGRARRSEFCLTLLALLVVSAVAHLFIAPVAAFVSGLAVIVALAASVRRLHDINTTGWWSIVYFFPPISVVLFFVLVAIEGTPCRNRFGQDPKYQFG